MNHDRRFLLTARYAALALAGILVFSLAPSASGQAAKPKKSEAAEEQGGKPRPRPNNVDRSKNLDFLFGALKAAPDADTARAIESRILALWTVSGSDTADLLMTRVKKAVDGKDVPLGLELLDAIVEIRPEFIEAWNRRATLHFMNKNFLGAIDDLRQVLAREPRHFGAMAGLGLIMQELGDEKFALAAFRRALELHPFLPRIGELVKTLEEKVEGRPI
jgi:Flp pilus assembly protein TadD